MEVFAPIAIGMLTMVALSALRIASALDDILDELKKLNRDR